MKKTLAGVILLLALSSLAGGCGKEAENLVEAPAENPEEESVEEELPEVQAWEEEQGFSFADVADREFYFSSGVGGWYTVLCIHEDGSFDGYFRDSNMGETEKDIRTAHCITVSLPEALQNRKRWTTGRTVFK